MFCLTWHCGRKQNFAWCLQCIPNMVTMFTTARGQNRTFYFPPANCLISCCRWRALCSVGEERRPTLADELACSLRLSQTLRWLRASPSLWSFVEIPNGGIWRCLSAVPFLSSHPLLPTTTTISSCYWYSCSGCHCLFCCPLRHEVKDKSSLYDCCARKSPWNAQS